NASDGPRWPREVRRAAPCVLSLPTEGLLMRGPARRWAIRSPAASVPARCAPSFHRRRRSPPCWRSISKAIRWRCRRRRLPLSGPLSGRPPRLSGRGDGNRWYAARDLPMTKGALHSYDPRSYRALGFHDATERFREGVDSPRAYLERCLATIAEREPV